LERREHYIFNSGTDNSGETLVAIRLYLSALTLVFLFSTWLSRGLGPLDAIVVTCALVYLILDTRERLRLVKQDVALLRQLEKKLAALLS
jgi:hypothetical protein